MPGDRLTSQLHYLPAIIGRMGINIAEAQSALNQDFLDSLHRAVDLIGKLYGAQPGAADAEHVVTLLREVMPSRYQFTEATIDFSADLAESLDVGAAVGVGMPGFPVSASVSAAFGYDYRAAARITAKLHAYPADKETGTALLARAKVVDETHRGALPAPKEVDEQLWSSASELVKTLLGKPQGG